MRFLRRRKFLINKNLQFSLLFLSFFYLILFSAVVGIILFLPPIIELGRADINSGQAFQAATKLLYLHSKFWPALLLSLIIIALHSIRTSHKIAGPLYRLNQLFDTLKEGHLPKSIRVRKGDYLLGEIERVNQMLENLQLKVKEIQKAQKDLNDTISQCRENMGNASKEEILQHIEDITEKGDQLGDKLSFFKISS